MQITDKLPLVVIESPYAGNVEQNVEFCRNVCRWAIERGYSPYAMHLLYPQMLDDLIADERAMGISCGLSWTRMANEVWYVLRPGDDVSKGMQMAIDRDTRRINMGEPLIARRLRFTQDGKLVEGWEGPRPDLIYKREDSISVPALGTAAASAPAPTAGSTAEPPAISTADAAADPIAASLQRLQRELNVARASRSRSPRVV